MSDRVQAPKGVQDLLPDDTWQWRAIEAAARRTAAAYHFGEIRTPVFEHSEVFHRGVGDATDIVTKETYTFDDRGGRSLTLRPEGTAGVVRALLSANRLNDPAARTKVFYLCPMFRFERPQKGRLRQHHQFGVEAFGIADASQDVECILLQRDFFEAIGLKGVAAQINSLGDGESKAAYRRMLLAFLEPKRGELSEDSQRRLATNPLRILDSKVPGDVAACEGAPAPADALSDASRAHFEMARELLDAAGVDYEVNPKLVRGLDYYTETLWEFTAGGLGSQNAVGGGGRYDNLVATLGGRDTPGVGFGTGIERLLLALAAQEVALPDDRPPLAWVVAANVPAAEQLKLLQEVRAAGFAADADLTGRSVKAQFKLADRAGAQHVLVLGDSELTAGEVVVKKLADGSQQAVRRERLPALLSG
jgi:histidyl-tRNA synthetase